MKKILSLALAAAMVMSALPVAYAAEGDVVNHTEGTKITLNGSGTEEWTVTVPAKLSPVAGQNAGTVKAEGTWGADTFLAVYAPAEVTLTYGAQSLPVAVTGGSFSLIGNSVEAVSKEVDVSIEEASRLFGTWEGVLEYQVALIQKGDVDRDGLITDADTAIIKSYVQNELEDEQLKANVEAHGDLNNDGEIGAGDYQGNKGVVAGTGGALAKFYTTTE